MKSLHRISRINFKGIKKNEFFEDIIGVELSDKLKREKNVRIQVYHLEEGSDEGQSRQVTENAQKGMNDVPLLSDPADGLKNTENEEKEEENFKYVSLTHFIMNPRYNSEN